MTTHRPSKKPHCRQNVLALTPAPNATYISPSNVVYYESLVADAEEGRTTWSISKHARRGDRVLLYICAPVKAIVAVATLVADPEVLQAPANEWHGTYMAEMDALRLLKSPITRDRLMQTFPGWRYWQQPHRSSRVKEEYLAALEALLKAA